MVSFITGVGDGVELGNTSGILAKLFGVLSRKANPGLLFEIGNRSGLIPV